MMALEMDAAAKDLSGAVDELHAPHRPHPVGVIGFCMGGGLALVLATQRPDAVKAVVPAYGLIPWPDAQPDYSTLEAAVLGHAAGQDDYFTPEAARALEAELHGLGKDVDVPPLPRCRPRLLQRGPPRGLSTQESAELLWDRTIAFFRQHAGLSGRPWPRAGPGRGVPDARPPPGPAHRRHGRRVLRAARPGRGGRGRAGGTAGPLVAEARALLAALDAGAPLDPAAAGAGHEDGAAPARRHWLRAQVVGLLTTCAQAGRGAHRLRRRGRGLLRRPAHPGGRGGAGRSPPSTRRGPARLADRWPSGWWPGGSPTPCRSTGCARPSARWPTTCATGPATCSACPTASTSSSSW